jgi:HAMP domain-containing protein
MARTMLVTLRAIVLSVILLVAGAWPTLRLTEIGTITSDLAQGNAISTANDSIRSIGTDPKVL